MRHIYILAMILSFTLGAFAEEAAVVEATDEELASVRIIASESQSTEAQTAEVKSSEEQSSEAKISEAKSEISSDDQSEKAVEKKEKKSKIAREKKKSAKSDKDKKSKVAKKNKKNDRAWNKACRELLDTSVKSTIALEKSLKKKKKLSRDEFDEKVQDELLIVQLNAWVCAISSDKKVGSVSVEEQFLKDYSKRIQDRNL